MEGAPTAAELFAALRVLVAIDDERGLFDRDPKAATEPKRSSVRSTSFARRSRNNIWILANVCRADYSVDPSGIGPGASGDYI